MTGALQPTNSRFVGREHQFVLRVYFEDTDLSGVVYHANYLRFMERARTDMLRLSGIDLRVAWESGGAPMSSATSISGTGRRRGWTMC